MKLFLSSYRLGTSPEVLADLVGGTRRAAIVFNALDAHGRRRLAHRTEEVRELRAIGLGCEELDLRAYFNDSDGLRSRLARVDLVWAVGGNSFVLARAMSASRFRQAAAADLDDGRLVYGGYSAGACVAGPDLAGCHLMDEPDAAGRGYPRDASPDTLGLVPFRVVPHFRSDHPEAEAAECAFEHLEREGLAYRTLADGQAIVVDDGCERLVGATGASGH